MTATKGWFVGQRVLVTGGAGFVGSCLVEHLVTSDALVTVIDNLATGFITNLSSVINRVDLQKLDIVDLEWEQILDKHDFDVIFHLAGNAYVPPSVENPAWDYELNFRGTFRLLETLRRVRWPGILIYASSAAVYGKPIRVPIKEDDPTVPISPYGVAKLAAERYIAVYSQLYGLKAASLRFCSVYGPRQRKQVVYDIIDKISNNQSELPIYGDGSQIRDFNYVEDTVRSAMIVAEHGRLQGETYNVASGHECSIKQLAEMICRILKANPRFVYSGAVRPGEPDCWVVDINRLTALGDFPEVSLDEGLARTVEWYQRTRQTVK